MAAARCASRATVLHQALRGCLQSRSTAASAPLPSSLQNCFYSSDSKSEEHVVVALGCNLGDRVENFSVGLKLLQAAGALQVTRHSCLYESAAAHVTDQPAFLNAAVLGKTNLSPRELLRALKTVEEQLGRDMNGMRWGPRPLDLDIIFYAGKDHSVPDLEIPHPRHEERDFVMAPVADLLPSDQAADPFRDIPAPLLQQMRSAASRWRESGGENRIGQPDLCRVIPLRFGHNKSRMDLLRLGEKTHIMGILNVTPDSFSDGGNLSQMDSVISTAGQMLDQGATILDLGGQSSQPNAVRVSPDEELGRVLPAIEAVRQNFPSALISVDTFYADVARAAVEGGADIVNDISGGRLDARMHSTVAELRVPYVLMHMRGDPTTMQSAENIAYADVVSEVAGELGNTASAAIGSGISPWRVVLDPGIGFSKTFSHNFQLIRDVARFRDAVREVSNAPILVGPSRKRFLGKVTGHEVPADRDVATAAAVTGCIAGGADFIRVHNVPICRDAAVVADAIWRGTCPAAA